METTVKADSAPPVVTISLAIKSEAASLRVKVKVAVSPDFKAVLLELIVMVGAVVSAMLMLWVALFTPDEVKVSVYAVPAVPLMPTPEKVATPLTALTVLMVVPTVVPLLLTVMVTKAVLLVMVLPKESLIVTTGWVVNAEPLALPAAEVLSATWVARPKVGVMLWEAVAKDPEVKVRV